MKAQSDFLFTYGTLMCGFDNPFSKQLRSLSSYHGQGWFPGLLYRISWYPGALYTANGQERVYGEIYRLNDPATLLPALDDYEDVFEDESAGLYVRKIIPVIHSDQSVLPCWVYLYNRSCENLEVIQGGNFYNSEFANRKFNQ